MIKTGCKILYAGLMVLFGCSTKAQEGSGTVKIVGEMRNVMWKGQLYGNISLDTIANKTNLYGLGPLEYLAGEIMVMDGRVYTSTVVSDSTMKVEETQGVKAPFFGYANIARWTQHALPDSIQTIQQLEQYLDKLTEHSARPFIFRLSGTVEQAGIHVVNLPKGSKVRSPEEAHRGQKHYALKNEQVDIIGFFSTEHQAVFTHHDTWLHMHLLTADRKKMGHLDNVVLKKGSVSLYLPAK